ncbi:MAG: hypothetical protein ACO3EF_08335 [Vulcanococcus sp.]|jgi:hypothetical protein
MPASAPQRHERYATAISIPKEQARHIAKRATALGISQAAYIRILIARDMGATVDSQPATA